MVFCIVELSIAFIFTIFTCSPKVSEKRIRFGLHLLCCCIIRDNNIIDSLVSIIMRQPSFRTFSLSDIVAGLLMTNLVYHEKNNLIKHIPNPDERLRIRTMRVHEFIEYIHRNRIASRAFSRPAQLSLSSEAVRKDELSRHRRSVLRVTSQGAEPASPASLSAIAQNTHYSCDEEPVFVVDRDGERYKLLAKNSADDIFAGMDVEMGQGSYAMSRMTYGISREQLNVAIPAG